MAKAPGLLLAAAFCGAAASASAYTPNHKDSGWVRLFDGKRSWRVRVDRF